jgi:hypothetical protein
MAETLVKVTAGDGHTDKYCRSRFAGGAWNVAGVVRLVVACRHPVGS